MVDGSGATTVSLDSVKSNSVDSGQGYESEDTEVLLTVGTETHTVHSSYFVAYPQLTTDNPNRFLCRLGFRVQRNSSMCSFDVTGPEGASMQVDVDGIPQARCTVKDGGCTIALPARQYITSTTVLTASLPGYKDESQAVLILLSTNQRGMRFYEEACAGNRCFLSYPELQVDAAAYLTKIVRYSGIVLEIRREGNSNVMRIGVGGNPLDEIMVAWPGERMGLVRGSSVAILGVVEPNYTYKNAQGMDHTLPRVTPVVFQVGQALYFANAN